MSVLQATTAPPAAAGAEHHAAATCAGFGTPAEHAQTGALNLTLPIPYGRHATTERRLSPTRFIRRHAAVVPALGLASAADKRYSLGLASSAACKHKLNRAPENGINGQPVLFRF
jgi:hypothetical protein